MWNDENVERINSTIFFMPLGNTRNKLIHKYQSTNKDNLATLFMVYCWSWNDGSRVDLNSSNNKKYT